MISKPWFQILAFVLVANAAQALLVVVGVAFNSELIIFSLLMLASLFCTAILVMPSSATTGHKLLTLTFAAATGYFALAVIATAWAMAGSLFAWYAYDVIYNNFALAMQFFTALEIMCVFSNAGARMGRLGEHFGRAVDYMYSSILLRFVRLLGFARI